MTSLTRFAAELKQRRVVRTALIYLPAAWAAFEATAQLGEVFALPDWLPRLVAMLLGIGFPVAMVLAWVFDITRAGVRRTGGAAIRGAALAAAVILMAAGSFVTWKLVEPPPVTLEVRCEQTDVPYRASIAVLPFRVVGAGGEALHAVAEGLADDVRSLLSRVPGFCVAARASSRAMTSDPDYEEVAKRLNVANIVEGSVRLDGDTYRITATLLQPGPSSFNLWSETFDRNASDLFALQDEVARRVVGGVHASAMAELDVLIDRESRLSGDAYHAYLLARYHYHHWLQDARSRVFELLDRVVELEPRSPEAWGLLASAAARECANRHCSEEEEQSFRERAESAFSEATRLGQANANVQAIRCRLLLGEFQDPDGARQAAERALELDINEPEAWLCLLDLEVTSVSEATSPEDTRAAFERAATYGETAVRLDPYSEAALVQWTDLLLFGSTRRQEGMEALVDATQVLPDSAVLRTHLGRWYFEQGQLADAAMAHEAAVRLDPANPWRRLWLGLVYMQLGDELALKRTISDMRQNAGRPFQIADMGFFLAVLTGSLSEYTEELQRGLPQDVYHRGVSLAFLGRDEEALPLLEDLSRLPGEPNEFYHEIAMLELASIYLERGRTEEAAALLNPVTEAYRWTRDRGLGGNGINAAVALYLLDRRDEAIDLMKQEIERDWTGLLFHEKSPAFRRMMDDPRFPPLGQQVRRHLRSEKQRLDRLRAAAGTT